MLFAKKDRENEEVEKQKGMPADASSLAPPFGE